MLQKVLVVVAIEVDDSADSYCEQSDFETSFAVFTPIDLAPPCAFAEQGITLPSPDYSLQLARETPTPSEVDFIV